MSSIRVLQGGVSGQVCVWNLGGQRDLLVKEPAFTTTAGERGSAGDCRCLVKEGRVRRRLQVPRARDRGRSLRGRRPVRAGRVRGGSETCKGFVGLRKAGRLASRSVGDHSSLWCRTVKDERELSRRLSERTPFAAVSVGLLNGKSSLEADVRPPLK